MAILEVSNLTVHFHTSAGVVQAVRGISFSLEKGRTLAIVGESGSGKSVTSRAILGILAENATVERGSICLEDQDLLSLSDAFAGGTMLYVISDEMIPETHAHGHERGATYALLIGFCLMLAMDALIG